MVKRACRDAGFEPRVGFESDDYHVLQGFVAAGLGVTLLPDLALPTLRSDIVVLPDRPAGARPPGLGRDAAHPLSARPTRCSASSSRRASASRSSTHGFRSWLRRRYALRSSAASAASECQTETTGLW